MKKKYIYTTALALLMCMPSCIDDDSNFGSGSINISIENVEESYDVMSYSSDLLEIHPVVKSSFPENDLEYEWIYYNPNSVDGITGEEKEGLKTVANTKDLAYSINLLDGKYEFYLVVKSKSTGYSQRSLKATVNVSSSLSKGFYILKENSEGNTDVDLYSSVANELVPDILKNYQGKAIEGKPRSLDVLFDMPYLDTTTDDKASGNCISITTDKDKVKWIRVVDAKTVKDESNCHFEALEGEKTYRCYQGYMSINFATSNGIYNCYAGSMGGIGTFGASIGGDASTHCITLSDYSYGTLYWDNTTNSICAISPYSYADYLTSAVPGYKLTDTPYECIKIGVTNASGKSRAFALLYERANPSNKVLYLFDVDISSWSPSIILSEVRVLDNNSNLANATAIAVNYNQSTIAYAVRDNKLYGYDLVGKNEEKELKLEGIPAGENITYIANHFFTGSSAFDYLFVGTQSSDTYNIYMYDLVGGEPNGKPAKTITGKGKLRKLEYIEPNVDSFSASEMFTVLDD